VTATGQEIINCMGNITPTTDESSSSVNSRAPADTLDEPSASAGLAARQRTERAKQAQAKVDAVKAAYAARRDEWIANHFAHIAVPFLAAKSGGWPPESSAGRRWRLSAGRCENNLSSIAGRTGRECGGSSGHWETSKGSFLRPRFSPTPRPNERD